MALFLKVISYKLSLMKKNICFAVLLLISFSSCKSFNFQIKTPTMIDSIICPENGNCSLELIPNKSIEFKEDEFGILYPIISEGNKTLFKYTFQKKPIKELQDSNYTEIIYAELETTISEMSLTNQDLSSIKLYFGRLCYCKGATGYYPIKNGTFKITQTAKDSVNFKLDFTITEVPQIISKINEIISLK